MLRHIVSHVVPNGRREGVSNEGKDPASRWGRVDIQAESDDDWPEGKGKGGVNWVTLIDCKRSWGKRRLQEGIRMWKMMQTPARPVIRDLTVMLLEGMA